jgi:hypothetical protein
VICEYFDATKGKKISRTYVTRLQDKVRALEMELSQYIEEEEDPQDVEDIIRPGHICLSGDDETPRFLGPSSGIAMTRLVIEEAKKYTSSRSIRELVPEVGQRQILAQSPAAAMGSTIPHATISAVPAPTLPSRFVAERLVEVVNQKGWFSTFRQATFLLH